MAASVNYVEFDIIEIARRVNITLLKQMNDGQWLARCPFCGDSSKNTKHGHLYLKPSTGEYACHRCGQMGKTIGMYAHLRGIDTKAAYKELVNADALPEIKLKHNNAPVVEVEPAPTQRRHEVYSAMLDILQLQTAHRADLIKRGLSSEYILQNNYKSYPRTKKERAALCEKLSARFNLSRVPGFFVNQDGAWELTPCPNGYFLPVRNAQKQIQGLQLRVLPYDPKKGSKYLWLSSNAKPGGASVGQCFHIAIPPGVKTVNRLWLTEGSLKADVASFFTNVPFLAMAGVNAQKGITDVLQRMNVKEVVMAYDMDREINPNVKKALDLLESKLASSKIQIHKAAWPVSLEDGEPYPKGIDDACLERTKQSLEVTEEVFVTFTKTVIRKVGSGNSKVTVKETVQYEVSGPSSVGFFERARGLIKKFI